MHELNIGIIGMGRMGITHYAILNPHPDVTISAVADPAGLILTMLNKNVSGLDTYKDYNEMLDNNTFDAVLVCTPPTLNFEIVKKLVAKNIPAFVEKPFVTQYKQAAELAKLYTDRRLVNQIGYVNRFNDIFMEAKKFLVNGLIGKVIRFRSEMFSCTINKPYDEGSGWRSSHETGGGAVFEMASHAIDLVDFLVGKPDRVTGSALSQVFSKKVEDAAFATFIYKSGITGTLNVNWCDTSYRKPANKIEVCGDGGKLLADQHSLKVFMNKENAQYKLRKGWNTLYITDIFKPVQFYVRGNEFSRQLYNFVDCVQKKGLNTGCTFQDGADVLETIEAIFSDYEQNGRIKV